MGIVNLENKTILVTGVAGFIGSNLVKRIYKEIPSATVIVIDNVNAYYDMWHGFTGSFMTWLSSIMTVHAMEMPGKRYDIGNLAIYEQVQKVFKFKGIVKYVP